MYRVRTIINLIQSLVVGFLISVGVLMVLGIKYMMGSAEEKAEYKKTFIPYIIGAIILFAAVSIVSLTEVFKSEFKQIPSV